MTLRLESNGRTENSKENDWKKWSNTEWEKERGTYQRHLAPRVMSDLRKSPRTKNKFIWGNNAEIETQSGTFPSCEHFRILC